MNTLLKAVLKGITNELEVEEAAETLRELLYSLSDIDKARVIEAVLVVARNELQEF